MPLMPFMPVQIFMFVGSDKKVHDHIDHIDRFWGETVKTFRTVRTKNVRETMRLLRQSIVGIGFLSARATIISGETDEERTCLLGGGAGRSSDRSSFRGGGESERGYFTS